MSAPYADLHAHTTVSDGRLTPPAVPPAAREADLSAVAVTDHDRVHPGLPAPVQTVDGVTVVRGVELRVQATAERLDLLGYGVERTDALDAELDRLQRDRVERGRRIVEAVERRLDVDLDVDLAPGFGRPHVARAVADSPADYDYRETFEELIGADCPCFVPREVTPLAEGVELLREASAAVGLAHPLRYDDPEAALSVAADLDAVEVHYPYDRPLDPDDPEGPGVGPETVARVADAEGLISLGGTDAHGHELGVAGPPQSAYDRLAARLPSSVTATVAGDEVVVTE